MSSSAPFKGQTVLLTGASGGLGRSIALALAQRQASTLILSGRRLQALQKVADECKQQQSGIICHCITADLADPDSVDALASQALKISNKIDVLINNGGVSSRSRFVDTDASVDRRVMQINFLSGAALAKALVPGMIDNNADEKQQQRRIIWISSVQGLVGIPHRTSYAASKFAVQGYCEGLRAELASSGVSVHTVSPGYIRTGLSKAALTGDGTTHGVMDATTEAGADPDDVAKTILDRCGRDHADFTVATTLSATAAVWMRLLCPALLRRLLVSRYEKTVRKESESTEKKDS